MPYVGVGDGVTDGDVLGNGDEAGPEAAGLGVALGVGSGRAGANAPAQAATHATNTSDMNLKGIPVLTAPCDILRYSELLTCYDRNSLSVHAGPLA